MMLFLVKSEYLYWIWIENMAGKDQLLVKQFYDINQHTHLKSSYIKNKHQWHCRINNKNVQIRNENMLLLSEKNK